ncbi:MAG: hypothetical protein OEW18_07640 [Candidatus Aminicenantes bacterium]|nr:hypothetical protein [Candidatus Aminicenantes bacterium]
MPEYKVTKILDQGTSNPIVNRLGLHFFDILDRNLKDLPEKRKEKIKQHLFECMKDLLKAEELKNAYITTENQAIQKIMSKNRLQFQTHAFSYEDPTEILKKYFEDFLIRCVIAVRKVVKIANIVFLKSIDGPKELKEYLKTLFPPTSPEMKMIEEDSRWIKKLYDLRGKAEHEELNIERFEAIIPTEGRPVIKLPRLPSAGATLREYLEVTLDDCLTFCEDMTVIFLNTKCSEEVQIVLIPEGLRHKYQDFKYILDLKREIKEQLYKGTNKTENDA